MLVSSGTFKNESGKSPSALEAALEYARAGLPVLRLLGDTTSDAKKRKSPAVKSWGPAVPSADQVSKMFGDGKPYWIGAACGPTTGRLVIDFDRVSAWDEFAALLKAERPDLFDRLCVVKTIKGKHVHLVCPDWPADTPFPHSQKLAYDRDEAGKKFALIETRGEGGYIVVPGGTAPYHHEAGPPVLEGTRVTPDELPYLLDLCRSLDRFPDVYSPPPHSGKAGDRPGDIFNRKCADNPNLILTHFEAAGWAISSAPTTGYRLRRPGKEDGSTSATFDFSRTTDGVPLFHNFSSNAEPFDAPEAYTPFSCFTYLNYFRDGKPDFSASTVALAKQGYGPLTPLKQKADTGRPAPAEPWAFKDAGEYETRRVDWLVPNWIPFGKVTIFEGDGEAGKSAVVCDIVSRATARRPMPDGKTVHPPMSVLWLQGEDDFADTTKPRIEAAGGMCDGRIKVVEFAADRPPLLTDAAGFAATLRTAGAQVVVVEVLALSLGVDNNRTDQVAKALAPVVRAAQETGAAIICIRQLGKGGKRSVSLAGNGSVMISAMARSVLLVKDKIDGGSSRAVGPTKGNLARDKTAYLFTLEDDPDRGVPVVRWQGEDPAGRTMKELASDLLDANIQAQRRRPAVQPDHAEAVQLCRDMLGKAATKEIVTKVMDETGLSRATVYRVLKEVKDETFETSETSETFETSETSACTSVSLSGLTGLTRLNESQPAGPGRLSTLLLTADQIGIPLEVLAGIGPETEADGRLYGDEGKPVRALAAGMAGPIEFLAQVCSDNRDPDLLAFLEDLAAGIAERFAHVPDADRPEAHAEAWGYVIDHVYHELFGWPDPDLSQAA